MKSKSAIIFIALLLSAPVRALDTADCAIWLCMPVGFAYPGCGIAHKAMISRLLQGKNPLPSFNSCEVQGPARTNTSHFDFSTGSAALMGSYTTGSLVVKPESLIKDGPFCNFRDSGHEEPRGCVATLRVYRVLENGQQMGFTYYRNTDGNDYVRNPITDLLYSADDIPPEALEGLF